MKLRHRIISTGKKFLTFNINKMKTNTLSNLSFAVAILLMLFTTSCSRKVGCYWSLIPQVETQRNVAYSPIIICSTDYSSEVIIENETEEESTVINCD